MRVVSALAEPLQIQQLEQFEVLRAVADALGDCHVGGAARLQVLRA